MARDIHSTLNKLDMDIYDITHGEQGEADETMSDDELWEYADEMSSLIRGRTYELMKEYGIMTTPSSGAADDIIKATNARMKPGNNR